MNITRAEPVLVPFDVVFGSSLPSRIYKANSNGAACHSSIHRAIVNGIYEVVERDALMVVWLNRLTLPRIEVTSRDPDPLSLGKTLEALSLELTYVDLTTDLQIPVILGVLRDRLNPDLFLLDMVSSLDQARLMAKLHRELAQFTFPYLIDQNRYRSGLSSDSDFNRITSFPDHLSFYQAADKNRQAAFLTASAETRSLGESCRPSAERGVEGELDRLIELLAKQDYEVIVVNCTHPLLEELGLHAVKVLVPGLQPLHAGYRFRVLGGERLYRLPQRMGLAERPMTGDDLNPWPHPFW